MGFFSKKKKDEPIIEEKGSSGICVETFG